VRKAIVKASECPSADLWRKNDSVKVIDASKHSQVGDCECSARYLQRRQLVVSSLLSQRRNRLQKQRPNELNDGNKRQTDRQTEKMKKN
jgi:hypothetical protein